MNAPALNLAAVTAPQPGGSSAVPASGAGATPLVGFEALIAALFPQPAAAAPTATPQPGDDARAEEPGDEAASSADEPASPATASAGDVNTALAASLFASQAVVAGPANPAPAAGPVQAAPALPRNKVPAGLPPLAGAGLPAKDAQAATETASDPDAAALDTAAQAPVPPSPVRPLAAPNPPSRSAAPGPALPPTASETARAVTSPAAGVEPQPQDAGPPPSVAPETTPSTQSAGVVAAAGAGRPEPAPSAPPRSARNERSERKGPAADAAPGTATAARLPDRASPIAVAAVETAHANSAADHEHAAVAEPDAAPEQPDGVAQSETRAAQHTATPATPGTHGVRGSPETVANLAAQIVKKLEGQSTRFDVELNPAGLGKVDVRLEIGAHGALTAAMTFDNPQAASELKARASELQRALEQAGFNLSGGLTFDVARDGGRQQQAWQDQPQSRDGGSLRGQAFRAALDAADAADTAGTGALRLRRGVTAGLDVRI